MWKKGIAFVALALWSGLGSWVIAGVSSAILLIMNEFNTDLEQTIHGVANWSILTIGLSVFPCRYPY